MLSKAEEARLNSFLRTSEHEIMKDFERSPRLSAIYVHWLARKLKEANDRLNEVEGKAGPE
jgi:hypothetical protein